MMLLVYIFALHFLADFVLQSREMGKKKSSELSYLFNHVSIQIAVFFVGLSLLFGVEIAGAFALLNGMVHMLIDAFVWKTYSLSVWLRRHSWVKENKGLMRSVVAKAGGIRREPRDNEIKRAMKENYKYWDDHWFYLTIGFDQFLHMSTLALISMAVLL